METIRQQVIDAVVNVLSVQGGMLESEAIDHGKYIADELDLDDVLGDMEVSLHTLLIEESERSKA